MLISIIAFIVVIGVLVVIHEAGHFGMARLLGAPVEVFSVGFVKLLWGFERGGTDYRSIRRLTVLCKAPLSPRDIRIARRCGPLLSRCGLGVVPA